MRGIWTVTVVVACVLVGLVGLTGVIIAESVPAAPALVQPALVHPAMVQPALVQPNLDEPVPRTSIATRHVRSPEEASMSGAMHPATDRVMALLIGWALLALLGGGLVAPRH